MKRGFFVTGTGTGVGKTFVAAQLAAQARAAGQRVFAFKPIETGCHRIGGALVGEDQERLAIAAGDWQQGELRRLYNFEPPLAPLIASRVEHQSIDLARIKTIFDGGVEQADFVLVEGAGGWRVPITEHEDMGSLAKLLGLPVIVVGLAGLGTINHSVLTVESIRRDGCQVAAVVLSTRPEDDRVRAHENASEIERLGGSPVLVSCETVLYDTI